MSASAIRHPLPCLLLATLITGCTVSPLSIDKEWGATDNNGGSSSDKTDTGGSSAASSGATSTGGTKATSTTKATGGTTSTGGTRSTGGTSSSGGTSTVATTTPPPACLGNPLPMPSSGYVAPGSNGCGITGSWNWYKDKPPTGTTLETRVTVPTTSGTPVISTSGSACLEGLTVVGEGAWGAGISLDLNNPNGTARTYDMTTQGIGGFEITVTGVFPQGLRMNFTDLAPDVASPFVNIARPGTYRIMLADAFVPIGWDATVAGNGVVPSAVARLQFQVVGGQLDKEFKFCVSSVIPLPLVDDGALGTKPVKFVSLPIDNDGIAAADTGLGIQGTYWCSLTPGVAYQCGTSTSVVTNAFHPTAGALYLSSTMGTDYNIWGGSIGLNLNATSTTAVTWNGIAQRLRGFRFTTKLVSSSPLPVRFATSHLATLPTNTVSPFVEYAKAGTHVAEMNSVACPSWLGMTCTEPDLAALHLLEVQIPTLLTATPYELSVTKLEAMIAR